MVLFEDSYRQFTVRFEDASYTCEIDTEGHRCKLHCGTLRTVITMIDAYWASQYEVTDQYGNVP